MIPVKKGEIAGMHFTAMAVTGLPQPSSTDTEPALIYRVELPFNSAVHLIGVPNRPGVAQIDPTDGGFMERVDLEGNYSKQFALFCAKGMQVQARYVLDPKAMVFTIDFCRSHNWEIIGGELYFVQATAAAEEDTTTMDQDIERFVHEIKPSVAIPLTELELLLRTPYGQDRRKELNCPLCGTAMTNESDYFSCPAGHGVLIRGAQLIDLKSGKLKITQLQPQTMTAGSKVLVCPSCGTTMAKVPYGGSDTIIDSCTNCAYRWLDAGELAPN